MDETFIETKTAWARLKRSFHLWMVGRHVAATLTHLKKLGREGQKAQLSIINAYLYDVPNIEPRKCPPITTPSAAIRSR